MSNRDRIKKEIYDRYKVESDKLLKCVANYNKARADLNKANATQGDYVVYNVAKEEWDRQSSLVDSIGSELARYKSEA